MKRTLLTLAFLVSSFSFCFGQGAYFGTGGPAGLPGTLAFWFEARLGANCSGACSNNSNVTTPIDQSGNANNLTPISSVAIFKTSIFGSAPAFQWVSGTSAIYNFASAVNFTASSSMCAVIKNIGTATQGNLVGGPVGAISFWTSAGATKEEGADKTGVVNLGGGTAAADTSAHLICYTYNGTTVSFYLDGAADGTASPSATITANETVVSNDAGTTATPLNANVGLLIGAARVFSAGEISATHVYAQTNYGTP